jgi:hypothetical protein
MTDVVEIAFIVACGSAIPAIVSTLIGFANNTAIRHSVNKLDIVSGSITQLEKNTNHKMDQLLAVTGAAEHAKGKLEGAAEVSIDFMHSHQERDAGL